MNELPPNDERRDREAHGLFAELRAHVVELSAGFGRSLSDRLDEVETRRGAGGGSLVGGLAVEVLNLLTGWVDGRGEDDGDD